MEHPKMFAVAVMAAVLAVACAGDDGTGLDHEHGADHHGPEPFQFEAAWPSDINSILVATFDDALGDQVQMPPEQAGPPYASTVPFPSVDVGSVRLGIDGEFLYMRVDFAGTIPTQAVHIEASGEIEEQWVQNQGMNIALNTDGDFQTGGGGEGVFGIDIFFAVSFNFPYPDVYVNWGFSSGDLHLPEGHALGELGEGGAGSNYAVVRYKIDELGSVFPIGARVDLGSWSEAESYNADDSLKYHHFAFDRVLENERWTIR